MYTEKKLLQAVTTQFSCHLPENSIFGHFSPFVPTQSQPLDPTSTFIGKNIIKGCCCNDIYKEKATPCYYHFPTISLKILFLAIFGHFSQLVPMHTRLLTWSLLLLTKMLLLGAFAIISMERELLKAIITPFFCHLTENWIFWLFLAIFHHLCLLMGDPMTSSLL